MIRITFFRNKCIGCNGCVEAAPGRWHISEKDGKSMLLEGKEKRGIYQTLICPDEGPQNEMAASSCPVNIIRLEKLK